jgi:hypothetical protein
MRLLRPAPFESDDFQWVYQRVPGYSDALRDGQFPPRVFPEAFEGGGYAFAHFYPPLSHWVATTLALLTGSPVWGVHLSFWASVVLASLAMYALARELTGSPTLGVVAAVIYTALPYHAADVYLRGALAESWSFVWFPLIALGVMRCCLPGRATWLLPLSVAGLILSHSVMALYFGCACAMGLLLVWRYLGGAAAARVGGGALVGLSLSLWHVLPAHAILGHVWAGVPEAMHTTEEAVREAAAGPGSPFFLIDFVPWFLAAVGAKVLIQHRTTVHRHHAGFAVVLLVIAAVYTLYAYAPGPFQLFLPERFAYIQFPWRVFAISGFLTTLALVLIAHSVGGLRLPAFLVIAATFTGLPYALLPGGGGAPTKGHERQYEATGATTYTVVGDYLPRPILQPMAAPAVRETRERASRAGVRPAPDNRTFSVRSTDSGFALVTLPLLHYPLYRVATENGDQLTVAARSGFIEVEVPPGTSTLKIKVINPPCFWWGLATGLTGILCWFLFGAGRTRTHYCPPSS